MKNCIINVKGINNRKKMQIIRGCMNRWMLDVVCLQETKMEIINEREIRSLWRMKEVGWHVLPAKKAAGGIVVLWREEKVECKKVLMEETTISYLFVNYLGKGMDSY